MDSQDSHPQQGLLVAVKHPDDAELASHQQHRSSSGLDKCPLYGEKLLRFAVIYVGLQGLDAAIVEALIDRGLHLAELIVAKGKGGGRCRGIEAKLTRLPPHEAKRRLCALSTELNATEYTGWLRCSLQVLVSVKLQP